MLRHRLTDEQWDLNCDLFASSATTGHHLVECRRLVGLSWCQLEVQRMAAMHWLVFASLMLANLLGSA